jgi:hypothetical protein
VLHEDYLIQTEGGLCLAPLLISHALEELNGKPGSSNAGTPKLKIKDKRITGRK